MTLGLEPQHGRRLRAPRESGSTMIEPPPDDLAAIVEENLALGRQASYDLHGRCLGEVSRQARGELLAAAFRWTTAYRDVDPPPEEAAEGAIFLAGHQPQLFHPGVWFKNFALAALARRHGATAVNLLIDTDTFRQNSIPLPGGSLSEPKRLAVPLDRFERPIPFEERKILDAELFAGFDRRAGEHLEPLVAGPLLYDYWSMVRERMRQTGNLGACLAQSRHQLEGRWGLSTLELPESVVCSSESFRWFTAHVLAHLPRFRTVYNEAAREYRRRNRIRNVAHPVPDLAAEDGWLEAPFWIWTAENPLRRRLFVRLGRDRVELSDRQGSEFLLSLSADGPAERAVEQLATLSAKGVKIRARALITTLWARLALGDLFIHGIGGAKYDQVTDVLVERFFGLRPPGFAVASGTLHLRTDCPEVSEDDQRLIRRRLRELRFHPEQYFDPAVATALGDVPAEAAPDPQALITAKRRWIETAPEGADARRRFLEIRRVNEALQPWVASERRRLEAERQRVAAALRARSVLCWREYPFCFYPKDSLRNFLRRLLPKNG